LSHLRESSATAAPTRRISIREIQRRDAPVIQTLASDREVAATSLLPHPYPEEGATAFIERSIRQRSAGTDFVFAVVAGDELVGVSGLHDLGGEPPSLELGYWIGRPFWRRGYGASAAAQVAEWAFRSLQIGRLTAHCLERNLASVRILEGLGFLVTSREANLNPKWAADDIVIRYELPRSRWAPG
jgi:RimJ/RimL family protein N-acetyltransferase